MDNKASQNNYDSIRKWWVDFVNSWDEAEWERLQRDYDITKAEALAALPPHFLGFFSKLLRQKDFEARRRINQDDIDAYLDGAEFEEWAHKLRAWLKVPDVKYGDSLLLDDEAETFVDSETWLEDQPEVLRREVDTQIKMIMEVHRLPKNFYGWLEEYVLWGKPKYKPLYNVELFFDILEDPKEARRLGLLTAEKKWLKEKARDFFVANRRLAKSESDRDEERPEEWTKEDGRKMYKKFLKVLDTALSPKRRKRRTVKSALATQHIGEKELIKTERFGVLGEWSVTKTHRVIVAKELGIAENLVTKKSVAASRQRKRQANIRKQVVRQAMNELKNRAIRRALRNRYKKVKK